VGGTRPRAPRDRRCAWACIPRSSRRTCFGAACPERAADAALVLPRADAAAIGLHLLAISRQVAPGAHAVVVLDGAGRHGAGGLAVPSTMTLLPLPPPDQVRGRLYAPELNPVENIWPYLRQNQLSHRVWQDDAAIVASCCKAWNALAAEPGRIASITRRNWVRTVSS
jgi:transposase